MAETATIEAPVAASEPMGAPPPEAPEIAPEEFLPENDAPELPENEDTEDDPYAGLTPREAAEKAREEERKAAEASRAEALRRQREQIDSDQRRTAAMNAAQAELRANQEKATAASRQAALRKVQAWIDGDAEGKPEEVQALVADLDAGARYQQLQSFDAAVGAFFRENGVQDMHSEVKVGYLQAAARGDMLGMVRALGETFRALGWEQRGQFDTSQAQTAQQEDAAGRAAAEALRGTRARNSAATQPTNVRGQGARAAIQTMDQADAAYATGQITHDQYKAHRKRFGLSD